MFYSFTYILPDYVAHGSITKNFENMTAGFLLRSQNLLRQISPKRMHFLTWKNMIRTNDAP